MTIYEEYAKFVKNTNVTASSIETNEYIIEDLVHHLLGLSEEVGELCAEYTKLNITKKKNSADYISELGDIFWHYQALLNYFDTDLETIISLNMNKLKERKK